MSNRSFRSGMPRILAILGLAAATLAFVFRFAALGKDQDITSIRSEQQRLGVPVETVTAAIGDISRTIRLAGTVRGVTQYPVVSNNALTIVDIPVREGARVEAGDLVVRLTDKAPGPMYHSLGRQEANYENLKKDLERIRNLYEQGAASRQQLDDLETQVAVARNDLEDARSSVLLRATRPGVVAAIPVRVGETAKANAPLVWIADTSEVIVDFDAGSNQALSLAVGQEAAWKLPDGGGLKGSVSRLDLMADPVTHLLAGEVTFSNPDGRLVPGLLISFDVRTGFRPGAVWLPEATLEASDGTSYAWVVERRSDEFRAFHRPVGTGIAAGGRIEVASGLTDGESVVLHGRSLLKDGCRVNVVNDAGGR